PCRSVYQKNARSWRALAPRSEPKLPETAARACRDRGFTSWQHECNFRAIVLRGRNAGSAHIYSEVESVLQSRLAPWNGSCRLEVEYRALVAVTLVVLGALCAYLSVA